MSESAAPGMVIQGRQHDLGGFSVRRVLPWRRRRMVGPFIFFDEMGPQVFGPGQGVDVRPHPHIGLATVTYMFDGELLHRDSLGVVQPIRPGEVNWMTAGKGIVHSERTPGALRASGHRVFGIQVWVALPVEKEECEPEFHHYGAEEIPAWSQAGAHVRLIAGRLDGNVSPVAVSSPLFYVDLRLEGAAEFVLPAEYSERAVYVVEGRVGVAGESYEPGQMLVFETGSPVAMRAEGGAPARVMLLGGEPVGERFIYWNFVSSRKERLEQAKADWREGRFPPVPDETEFIPLPGEGPAEVSYP